MDYKPTVHLPKTDFAMKANLSEREPAQLKRWEEQGLYEKTLARNTGAKFVFHDGPPYANGHLHEGHFLNKILKDIVVKYRNLSGQRCDFVPGWDCHGLPIELQVDKKLGSKKREMSAADFRRACRQYANEQIDLQRAEFKRLGVFARWDQPYTTMSFGYEAHVVRELAKFVEAGRVYRKKRPVYWCPRDATALAEAEVEYEPHTSPSIYVAFEAVDAPAKLRALAGGRPLAFAIWTTTPWTIPANLAIAVNPDVQYVVYELGGRATVVAKELLASFLAACAPDELASGVKVVAGAEVPAAFLAQPTRVLGYLEGADLAGSTYRHPLWPRVSPVLAGAHVTTTDGTGLVHTAPGHGEDDYRLGLAHGLDVYAPLDDRGRFTADVPELAGKSTVEANALVPQWLAEKGALLNQVGETVTHSYPHCWRCHNPILFRATDQWFIALGDKDDAASLRAQALRAIDDIASHEGWIPKWGRERIWGMMENRPDWCISRQRAWGVPIPVFYCEACNECLLSAGVMERVAGFFEQEGADAWFERTPAELLAPGMQCPKCGGNAFRKEKDILDVWFDSGSSAGIVLGGGDLPYPADLYLEGSDQHRGWFNSSLLIGLGTRGAAPYKTVLTHGFVVDGEGRKMSKSLGNSLNPDAALKKYGAEVMRLWVAAADYRDDIRVSTQILDMLSEGYRKLRNTLRYCLSNLGGFEPGNAVAIDALLPLDRWALGRLAAFERTVQDAYERYEFHVVYHAAIDLAATDLSATYFDVLKDRLYCEAIASHSRRSAQTVLWHIVERLCRWLAPLISFTAEEAYQLVPGRAAESVFLAGLPQPLETIPEAIEQKFAELLHLRSLAFPLLEKWRAEKKIGKGLEAAVRVASLTRSTPDEAAEFLIVSKVEVLPVQGVELLLAPGTACARCNRVREDVSGALCGRCAAAVATDFPSFVPAAAEARG